MSSMPLSTANWHWKNKNVTPWAKSWFESQLTTIEIKEGEEVVSITEVTDVDGDVELGQRKSKLITIYDCSVSLKWEGTASDNTKVSGKLTIPEVSHEITLDKLSDYVYNWSLSTTLSPAVDKLYTLAKKRFPAALETKFEEFAAALIDTHGKDLQVNPTSSAEPSRTGTPTPTAAPVASSHRLWHPADDLFQMLTDQSKIPMWTRAAAQSKPEPGAPFSLFGGGVKGTFVSLEKPGKFVQKWALASPTWPSEHYATLTTLLQQSSDSTKVVFALDGVPTGIEDEIRRNMEGYYIQGLKSIGLGTAL
ncbi:activator of Hsp90 ATPase [Phellopilus nigrolimitatus]|nr:activator of Hsp90 ATPase [Phellopilus nigrolimitatus]